MGTNRRTNETCNERHNYLLESRRQLVKVRDVALRLWRRGACRSGRWRRGRNQARRSWLCRRRRRDVRGLHGRLLGSLRHLRHSLDWHCARCLRRQHGGHQRPRRSAHGTGRRRHHRCRLGQGLRRHRHATTAATAAAKASARGAASGRSTTARGTRTTRTPGSSGCARSAGASGASVVVPGLDSQGRPGVTWSRARGV